MTIGFAQLAMIELWGLTLVALPASAGLAAVALLGYLFGRRTRSSAETELDSYRQRELERAAGIAWQLESIADRLRQDLASHHSQVEAFKTRLRQAQERGDEQAWNQLCAQAETILGPTMQLALQLTHAYDKIRQQSEALETFTQGRTDPLTGVGSGRALDAQLQVLLAPASRISSEFVVAIVSLDGELKGDEDLRSASRALLPRLALIIQSCMRDSDSVARFGEDEFVVVMPQTGLAGACVFCDRLGSRVTAELGMTVSCGAAVSIPADDAKSLLARSDSALYSAKASGKGRVFTHTGSQIREHAVKTSESARPHQEVSPTAEKTASPPRSTNNTPRPRPAVEPLPDDPEGSLVAAAADAGWTDESAR